MTLMQAVSFIAVGNKNRLYELFLESRCEKAARITVGTVFPQLSMDFPSHVPFLKLSLALPNLKLREKGLHFFA